MKSEKKEILRQTILAKREMLSSNEVYDLSKKIIDTLLNLKEYYQSKSIMSYLSFKNEVITHDFVLKSLNNQKSVSIPKILDNVMIPYIIYSLSNLTSNKYGILEPESDSINPLELDMVVVPGIAFDYNKNRIGYGKGYYDRFLKNVRANCLKVGLCFEIQLCEDIFSEIHDIPMDIIITENRIIV